MPGGDRTGPRGTGPMTGRAAGVCAGYGQPGYANAGVGPRVGLGRGAWCTPRGRGYRHVFYGTGLPAWARPMPCGGTQPPTREEQQRLLRQQAQQIEQYLSEVNQRLDDLAKEG